MIAILNFSNFWIIQQAEEKTMEKGFEQISIYVLLKCYC